MIHFIIGTKAQFIKMAPLMHVLQSEGNRFRVIDLGQHAALTGAIMRDFDLEPEIFRAGRHVRNVESYFQAARWLAGCLAPLARGRAFVRARYFGGEGGVALIHGDTLSTLIGLYLARRAGIPAGLVEAGLTSGRLLDPFPEEMIRRHAERNAGLLFAPDETAAARLRALAVRGRVFSTGYNTGRDALALMIRKYDLMKAPGDAGRYSVLTLHRLESISSRRGLSRITRYMIRLAAETGPIRFYLHGPTLLALRRTGLLEELRGNAAFTLAPLLPYPEFMRQVIHCRYLFTDGGSIQEEASYLHKPTLLLRRRTERPDGLADTVRLASFDATADLEFLEKAVARGSTQVPTADLEASRRLLGFIRDIARTSWQGVMTGCT